MNKRTVLVVDDEKINRLILGKMLKNEFFIMEACNGKEALVMLRNNLKEISAVLLDIVMPVMDGYGVLKEMNADSELSKIPVIVTSYLEDYDTEIKILSLGAQDLISKPYKSAILQQRLNNLIKLRETAALINKVERDELTGLYNKSYFINFVTDYLNQNRDKSFDIMCIGIERFRLVNESYGVAKGDELLKYIASLVKNAKRPICIAHFSGDLFFLLVPHRDVQDSQILEEWYKKINMFPIEMNIKLHCGIYKIDEPKLPVSSMCDRAQLASEQNKGMYDHPFYIYDNSLRQKMFEEQFMVNNMKQALAQKQFQVFYQPKYEINHEQIAGAEALVRWIHPIKGFISPGAFIPIFEKNGFIGELDQYVWECACRDLHDLIKNKLNPPAVSINVSRADIFNPKLSDILLSLLQKYDVPIHYLHLEITESAYTENPEQIISEVKKLQSLGFIIEMDDFGSGYSSLNMLAEMPVDVLKLDIRFIQNEVKRSSGKGILSFVISLAKWLNLAVVAEGAETKEQVDMLRSMDCNYVQGYYFAKPMKYSDFVDLLKKSTITEMICNNKKLLQDTNTAIDTITPTFDKQILIVDDMDINRVVLNKCFNNEYTIIEKENGSEALEYIDKHYEQIEIILLDLLMPVMDGFQLLAKIKSNVNTKNIPVIITSQGDISNEIRALEMLADDFISKPYTPDVVRHRVHNVINSCKYKLIKIKE